MSYPWLTQCQCPITVLRHTHRNNPIPQSSYRLIAHVCKMSSVVWCLVLCLSFFWLKPARNPSIPNFEFKHQNLTCWVFVTKLSISKTKRQAQYVTSALWRDDEKLGKYQKSGISFRQSQISKSVKWNLIFTFGTFRFIKMPASKDDTKVMEL